MKKQFILWSLFLVFLGMSSCTKYYYSMVYSDRPDLVKNEMGDFVQENDTVAIVYSFHGEDLGIHISIYNKLNKPIYVDWTQSALIVDDWAGNYLNETKTRKEIPPTVSYSYRNYKPSDEPYGVFGRIDGVTLIPPQSKVGHVPIVLSNFSFIRIPSEKFEKKPFLTTEGEEKKVKVLNFTEDNSPLRFRSYLTLYTVGEDGKRENTLGFDQSFYMSVLLKAGTMSPDKFNQFAQQRGDFFFVRDERGKNAGAIVGVIAIGAAGIALEIVAGPSEY